MNKISEVRAAMVADLKRSNLDLDHARKLKLTPFTAEHNLAVQPAWAGYQIPYFTPKGAVDKGFYRFRYVQQKPERGWRSLALPTKPRRYAQPSGTQCGVYLPPLMPVSWESIMKDPAIPIGITEGEKKAAAMCAHDVLPTLGLGGVYNWRSARQGWELLPILESINWPGRAVFLLFDSDTSTNPMVQIAASQLARTLTQRGALVSTVELPNGEAGAKQGVDDILVNQGREALEELIKEAKPVKYSVALHDMNLEVAVVHETGEVVELTTGHVYPANKFSDVVYRHRRYMEFPVNAKGEQLTPRIVYTAKEWLAWPQRTTVHALAYAPGEPRITSSGDYNMWRGWGCEPSSKGTLQPFHELIEMLMSAAAESDKQWLLRWLAYPLRHPGTKLYSAVVMWGRAQGTGKTLLGETMRRIYGANYRAISNNDLVSAYNDWVVNHQFIVGDEISTGDRRSLTDNLKDIITREEAVVNLKYRAQYTVRDCANYYFTSNHSNAFFIEDQDRRYFVNEVVGNPAPASWYNSYLKWLDAEGGASRLFHYLASELSLGDFDPKAAAPVTSAKLDMVLAGKSDVADWCLRLKANPESILTAAGRQLPYNLYSSQDLLRLYDPDSKTRVTLATMTRELHNAGFQRVANGNNTCLVDGVRTRLWAVKGDLPRLARLGPAQASKLYEQEREAVQAKFAGRRVQ